MTSSVKPVKSFKTWWTDVSSLEDIVGGGVCVSCWLRLYHLLLLLLRRDEGQLNVRPPASSCRDTNILFVYSLILFTLFMTEQGAAFRRRRPNTEPTQREEPWSCDTNTTLIHNNNNNSVPEQILSLLTLCLHGNTLTTATLLAGCHGYWARSNNTDQNWQFFNFTKSHVFMTHSLIGCWSMMLNRGFQHVSITTRERAHSYLRTKHQSDQ